MELDFDFVNIYLIYKISRGKQFEKNHFLYSCVSVSVEYYFFFENRRKNP